MKNLFLLAFFALAVSFTRRQPQPTAYVFWGDSIMAGNELNHSGSDGANNIYLRWPKQYAETIKSGFELNDAQSGAPLCSDWGGPGPFETRLAQVEGYDPTVARMLFIGYGFNDMSRASWNYVSLPSFINTFTQKLTNAVQYIKTNKGWPGDKIVLVWNYVVDNPPYGITQANWESVLAAVRGVATAQGVCMLDFHTFWKNRSDRDTYTDGELIHPNENANTIMAANVDNLIEYPSSGGGGIYTPPPGVIPIKSKKFIVQ